MSPGLGWDPEIGACRPTGRNKAVTGAAPMHYHADGVPCYWPHPGAERPALVVGLTGYAQSGKDTTAGFMAEDGFERLAFADKLKDLALAANPTFEDEALWTLRDLVEEWGWEYAKAEVPGVREFLQNLGVGVREVIGEDTWVRAVMDQIKPGGKYVVTDVRFPNELDAINAACGHIVRIARPGTGPANAHVSEQLDGSEAEAVILNNGSLDQLRATVLEKLLPTLRGER